MNAHSAETIDELLAATKGKVVAWDEETTGLDPFTNVIKGISFAIDVPEPREWYIPVGSAEYPYTETLERLAPMWAEGHCERLVAHNAPFDYTFLAVAGYWIRSKVACTIIAAKLVDENRLSYKLDDLGGEWLGEGKLTSYAEVGGFFGPPIAEYAKKDASLCLRLWRYLEPLLRSENVWKVFEEIEMEILPHIAEMTVRGLPFDLAHLHKMRKKVRPEIQTLTAKLHEMAGGRFNVSSPAEVGDVLFRRMKISDKGVPKTKTGQYSTDADLLEDISERHPIIEVILEFRGKEKLLNAFIEPYMRRLASEPRIHPTLKQCEATTGRMSCADPNIQQVDKDPDGLRGAVKAPEGQVLIQADLSQIELRLAAWRSQDANMMQAFIEKKDLHKITGTNAANRRGAQYDETWRDGAKVVNFGVLYGMAKKKLAKTLKCTEDEAQEFIDATLDGFPGLRTYRNEISGMLWDRGYVTTFTGRKRRFPTYRQDKKGWTQAINHPIQGGCADMLKLALRNFYRIVWERRRSDPKSPWWDVYVLMCIHDEMLVMVPEAIAREVLSITVSTMENVVKLNVPIVSEGQIVRTWGESKKKAIKRLEQYYAEGMSEERIRWFFHNNQKLVDEFLSKKKLQVA